MNILTHFMRVKKLFFKFRDLKIQFRQKIHIERRNRSSHLSKTHQHITNTNDINKENAYYIVELCTKCCIPIQT